MLFSCHYFDKKKVDAEDILEEELQSFNWNEVDVYPTFKSCDTSATEEARKQCFQKNLTTIITNNLNEALLVVTEDINDTVYMEFQITESGQLSVNRIQNSEKIKQFMPQIDSLLINSVKDLPQIYPAIKRGQQVTTEFRLPVVIATN